jgi:hypothetical protein
MGCKKKKCKKKSYSERYDEIMYKEQEVLDKFGELLEE